MKFKKKEKNCAGGAERRQSSRVAKTPAEITFCEGEQRVVAGAQGNPVHVGPRLGPVAGVEVLGHAPGSGDPGEEQEGNNSLNQDAFKHIQVDHEMVADFVFILVHLFISRPPCGAGQALFY